MLELIVLGEIPGTQIVMTFQSVLAAASLILGFLIARQIVKPKRNADNRSIDEIVL